MLNAPHQSEWKNTQLRSLSPRRSYIVVVSCIHSPQHTMGSNHILLKLSVYFVVSRESNESMLQLANFYLCMELLPYAFHTEYAFRSNPFNINAAYLCMTIKSLAFIHNLFLILTAWCSMFAMQCVRPFTCCLEVHTVNWKRGFFSINYAWFKIIFLSALGSTHCSISNIPTSDQ